MKLETRDFGTITIAEEEIIKFPQGLPGFEEEYEFVLLTVNKEESPFLILQSVNTVDLAFITMDPWKIVKDYAFDIGEQTEKLLAVESPEDLLILGICTIKDKREDMTINLAAPVVINYKKKRGKQVILEDSGYPIKQPVFDRQGLKQVSK